MGCYVYLLNEVSAGANAERVTWRRSQCGGERVRIASHCFVSLHIALVQPCCNSIKVRFSRVNGACDFRF